MNIACVLTVAGVWIEKGMGMIIPAFVPTPIGEIYEYAPTPIEIGVTIGIWGLGLMIFTLLAKAAIPIACGGLRAPDAEQAAPRCDVRGPAGEQAGTATAASTT
jgi:molybdopterin-containing oxidoreductase family membrane subunit